MNLRFWLIPSVGSNTIDLVRATPLSPASCVLGSIQGLRWSYSFARISAGIEQGNAAQTGTGRQRRAGRACTGIEAYRHPRRTGCPCPRSLRLPLLRLHAHETDRPVPVLYRGSTLLICSSSQMITGVPDSLTSLMTFWAGTSKSGIRQFGQRILSRFLHPFLRLLFDPPIQPLLLDVQLPISLRDNQIRRKSGCVIQPPATEYRAVEPKKVSHARLI